MFKEKGFTSGFRNLHDSREDGVKYAQEFAGRMAPWNLGMPLLIHAQKPSMSKFWGIASMQHQALRASSGQEFSTWWINSKMPSCEEVATSAPVAP